MSKTIEDVRRALYAGYQRLANSPDGYCGKSSDGYCEVRYPEMWRAEWEESKYVEPMELMVWSYALGPSRQHFFKRGPADRQINYYTWESPDIFSKAVEVIGEWVAELEERIGEDTAYVLTEAGRAEVRRREMLKEGE